MEADMDGLKAGVRTGGRLLAVMVALLLALPAAADTQNQTPVKSLVSTNDSLVISLLQGQSTCTADLSGTWTGTVTLAVSGNLQASWATPVVVNQDGSQGSATQTGNGTWRFDCAGFTNARILLQTAGTGTVTARLTTSTGALTAGGTQNVLPIATLVNLGTASVSGATNAATVVKSSAGNVYGVVAQVGAAQLAGCFLQFYNSSTAPTCGTGVVASVAFGTSTSPTSLMSDLPLQSFSSGIGVCVSTTPTGGTTCGATAAWTVVYR